MSIEEIIEIVKCVVTVLSVVIAIASFVLSRMSKSKNKRIAANASAILVITDEARNFITQAEQILNFTGENKKEWVMTKLNQYCIEHSIEFIEEEADAIVENLIEFTNNVNVEKKEPNQIIKRGGFN